MKKKKQKNKKSITTVILVIVLLLLITGTAYAAWNYSFNGTLTSSISKEEVSFKLLESDANIINISNSLPISDGEGKQENRLILQ